MPVQLCWRKIVQFGDEDFHEFDPYAALVQMSELLAHISKTHNELVDDYLQSKARIQQLEKQVKNLKNYIVGEK